MKDSYNQPVKKRINHLREELRGLLESEGADIDAVKGASRELDELIALCWKAPERREKGGPDKPDPAT